MNSLEFYCPQSMKQMVIDNLRVLYISNQSIGNQTHNTPLEFTTVHFIAQQLESVSDILKTVAQKGQLHLNNMSIKIEFGKHNPAIDIFDFINTITVSLDLILFDEDTVKNSLAQNKPYLIKKLLQSQMSHLRLKFKADTL